MARPAKEVIQVGSVIGAEFFLRMLQAVHPIAEEGLSTRAAHCGRRELIYVRGIAPDALTSSNTR